MKHALDIIDSLIEELNKLPPLSPENRKKLDNKFRLEFNYNSNHLEGNTLTYGETKLLLIFDDTRGSHTMREYEEMKAHDVAYHLIEDWAKDKDRPLTEQNIKNLNEVILVRPFWKEAITQDGQPTRRLINVGNYKEYPNSVRLANGEIFEYASPTDTPIQMNELIDWYRSEENGLHPVTLAGMFHYKFVRIHPFDDGNGRVSRLLMNYVLLKNGFPPVIIKSADKANYLKALHDADIGNYESFITYIAEQLIWSLEITIKAQKGESIDEPEDIDKKLALLEKELQEIDEENEIKYHFSWDVYLKILKSWGTELIRTVVPTIQKFNHLFTETRHNIKGSNTWLQFDNEPIDELIQTFILKIEEQKNNFRDHDCTFGVDTFYGSFKKGGLNSFGCTYSVTVKFDTIKYEVYVDEFSSGGRSPVKIYEKLLHKPLTKNEIDNINQLLGNTIFEHIDYHTKKTGLRK